MEYKIEELEEYQQHKRISRRNSHFIFPPLPRRRPKINGNKGTRQLEDFVQDIIQRNDPIPNRKVNMLRMKQQENEKPSDFYHRVERELDRAYMDGVTTQ